MNPTRPAGDARGARRSRLGLRGRLGNYVIRHLQTFFYALGQLVRQPFATLMTASVIGIALALPTGLHLVLSNAQQVTAGWDGATRISLFLHAQTTTEQAHRLARDLEQRAEIAQVQYISAEQALEEFRLLSGFGEALDALDSNPLPALLIVQPNLTAEGPEAVNRLLDQLRSEPPVDLAQLDLQWVKRLYALMDIVQRGVWVLATLLALAVLLVVGNTIRLAIQNRRAEIVITKLIGGTDGFIRRPFLYTGFWYGLSGGVVALLLVSIALLLLREPVHQLALLYHSPFRLDALDGQTALTVLGAGTLLGLGGSWLAVGRHLRDIEPT